VKKRKTKYAAEASARVVGIGLAILLLAMLLAAWSGMLWPAQP
jgi:hypothetical protein